MRCLPFFYNYWLLGHYSWSCFYLKQGFGDWTLPWLCHPKKGIFNHTGASWVRLLSEDGYRVISKCYCKQKQAVMSKKSITVLILSRAFKSYLPLLAAPCLRVPASHGGRSPSWVLELSPSHSHSNSWLMVLSLTSSCGLHCTHLTLLEFCPILTTH
jgi:hypothetical protein